MSHNQRNSDRIIKVAIYCRLSEEDRHKQNKQEDSNSIRNQKAMLMQYAVNHGWEIFDIYSDDDYAGSDRNRPQFKRLLADAEARRFDIILCKTQSRFTRELELVEKYIHGLFTVWGIRFVSIVDNADTANKGNKKSRQINGLVNEWYLEDMSDNIRSVLTNRRENGFHIGAFAPYGYQKDPAKKGHLIIDEEAAEIVREIFAMFAHGYGKTAIARKLNDRGIPNPTEYKRQKGLSYKQPPNKAGVLWKYTSVSDILSNEVYIGNLVQGKNGSVSYKSKQCASRPKEKWIRVEGTHAPIVEEALWNSVQKKARSHARPGKQTGMLHLFSGIACCAHCGYAVKIHKGHGRNYLQCETRQISSSACPGAFIPEAELEQIVVSELRKLNHLLDMGKLQRDIKFQSALHSQKEKLLSEQKGYQEKAEEYSSAIMQLYIDRVKGFITQEDFLCMAETFRKNKDHYVTLAGSLHEKIQDIDVRIESGGDPHDLISRYVTCDRFTRYMAEILIERIEIGKRHKETKQVPVTIHWNF